MTILHKKKTGFGVVGEYFGWWDHFRPMTDRFRCLDEIFHVAIRLNNCHASSLFTRDNPVDMVEMIQKEDATTWRTINMVRHMPSYRNRKIPIVFA